MSNIFDGQVRCGKLITGAARYFLTAFLTLLICPFFDEKSSC
uniref:Uncharacterized protein n=1 Tax=Vibrio tasmaniensis TaxID=212663 RepID=A0A0H3ZUV5_9VIBR|nr:hypothetical protein [Vibrio tasmaniensis]